jgi:tricorn protease-like protein
VGVNDTARLAIVDSNGNNQVVDLRSHWRRISGIEWLKNGFLLSARATGEALLHLWQVAPDGGRHRLTPDLSDYWGLGLTKDLRTIVAVQERSFSNLWRIPITSAKKAEQLVEGVTRYSRFGLTRDGRLIYEEQAGDVRRLVMSDHGRVGKPLTTSGKSNIGTVCPDNRTLLYTWHDAGPPALWKMNTDGSAAVAIGKETNNTDVTCSGDSRWAIYTAPGSGKYSTLWKANLLDGRAVQLTTKPSEHPALSPDGRRIAFFYVDEMLDTHQRPPELALISSEGGRIQEILPLPATVHKAAGIKWTPDGRSVTYVTFREGTAEIWVHPVSGGTPSAILRFPRELIHSFEWAPDGHDLYVSRGPSVYDVVMMSIR